MHVRVLVVHTLALQLWSAAAMSQQFMRAQGVGDGPFNQLAFPSAVKSPKTACRPHTLPIAHPSYYPGALPRLHCASARWSRSVHEGHAVLVTTITMIVVTIVL